MAAIKINFEYTGTFDLASDTLSLYGDLDLRTGGLLTGSSGNLNLIGTGNQNLYVNQDDTLPNIIKSGSGYLSIRQFYVMFELIAETVEAVGAENFTSQALYDVAQNFTLIIDGVESDSFSETKRTSANYMGMYEVQGANKGLFSVGTEWIPVVLEP